VNSPLQAPYSLTMRDDRYEICPAADLPPIRLHLHGEKASLLVSGGKQRNIYYRMEAARGYPDVGDLWSPGYFHAILTKERPVSLVASVESWPTILAMTATQALNNAQTRRKRLIHAAVPAAIKGPSAELVLAADQFVITPVGREQDTARAFSAGDEVRTVIAGYHWFTDWGRDTMISLEGLTLCTGRVAEAGYILRTFSHYIRDGLIPNYFPDGENQGVYHTADATLWFFHAIDRYLRVSGDRETLRAILPKLVDIVQHHIKGTRFGIHVDPSDGLLTQGADGYQLTWMDAKVGDWVVTPRRGKAVEINALWYNALRLLEGWLRDERGPNCARKIGESADKALASFNARFWNPETGYLFDVVDGPDGDDPLCRPNQVFAISLPNPVLDPNRWRPVMDVVKARLVTPVGLRSLAPGSPDYKPNYEGDLRSRDAAYHQGTVWAWLVGPYVDAWLKTYPDDLAGAQSALDGFVTQLNNGCIGSISEIFDAESPFTQRGCVAQAWSVAELLRALIQTKEFGAMEPVENVKTAH
jgi:predicted glycogen debranching enzyme